MCNPSHSYDQEINLKECQVTFYSSKCSSSYVKFQVCKNKLLEQSVMFQFLILNWVHMQASTQKLEHLCASELIYCSTETMWQRRVKANCRCMSLIIAHDTSLLPPSIILSAQNSGSALYAPHQSASSCSVGNLEPLIINWGGSRGTKVCHSFRCFKLGDGQYFFSASSSGRVSL